MKKIKKIRKGIVNKSVAATLTSGSVLPAAAIYACCVLSADEKEQMSGDQAALCADVVIAAFRLRQLLALRMGRMATLF